MFPTFQIAVAILLEHDGKILLGRRSADRDFAAGIWEIPAGRIEQGESFKDALIREGREELGVEITPHKLVDAYQFERGDQPMVLLTYYCHHKGEIEQSDEHKSLRWVKPGEAIDMLSFEKQRNTIRKFLEIRLN